MDVLDDDLVDFLDDEDDQLFSKVYQKLEIGNNLQQHESQETHVVDVEQRDSSVSTIDGQCDIFEPFIVVECDDMQQPKCVQESNCTNAVVETTTYPNLPLKVVEQSSAIVSVVEQSKNKDLELVVDSNAVASVPDGSSGIDVATLDGVAGSYIDTEQSIEDRSRLDQSSAVEQQASVGIDIFEQNNSNDTSSTLRFNVLLYRNKGKGGASMVKVCVNQPMPKASPPHKIGEKFVGFFDSLQGGRQYYDSDMNSLHDWDKPKNTLLYARYERTN